MFRPAPDYSQAPPGLPDQQRPSRPQRLGVHSANASWATERFPRFPLGDHQKIVKYLCSQSKWCKWGYHRVLGIWSGNLWWFGERVSASFLPRLSRTAFTPVRNLPAAADFFRPVAMQQNKNPLKSLVGRQEQFTIFTIFIRTFHDIPIHYPHFWHHARVNQRILGGWVIKCPHWTSPNH